MCYRLIVGCGYVGCRTADLWQKRGDTVFAITRSQARAQELSQLGIQPIVWNWLDGQPPENNGSPENNAMLQKLRTQSAPPLATLLIAVSHAPQPNIASQDTHTRGLANVVQFLETIGFDTAQTKWIYLSTTGVFGPSNPGDWVDENSPVAPERPGSIAAFAGEQWIAKNIRANERVVLRPVGIYGPGRVPRWQSIRDQIPLQVNPESYLNLIHVDDLAASIASVSAITTRSDLYCLSDGAPVLRKDYYQYVSELGNWPSPVFESFVPSRPDRASSRSDGNKRVRNSRIQSELAIPLQFPSYREGLKSLRNELGNELAM